MNNGFILFYDSGVGGLTTLSKTQKLLKKERFLYFADNGNCPLGNKSQEQIEKIVLKSLNWLLKRFEIKLIVFACNTITACCIERLRKQIKVKIVGIEPAILPASRASKTNNILVLATNATICQGRYSKLVKKSKANVISYPLKNLAFEIEKSVIENSPINLEKYAKKINLLKNDYDIDALVLGCTHYCVVKRELEKLTNITCYDGNDGVSRQIKNILERNSLLSEKDFNGQVEFIFSKKFGIDEEKYRQKYRNLLIKLYFLNKF